MIGLVAVSHGRMAEGMLDAMRMITGEQEKVEAVALRETDDVEGLMERIQTAAASVDDGEGVLVLVDLFGASPFNASARLALAKERALEVVTGMSLPMLVEIVVQREGMNLNELAELAKQSGLEGIRVLSEAVNLE